ncbi:hypothetical protein [Mycobacteroides abscessus]|uniref:hypothetical protein n=1 Tax=Mycobacteroides abscessus TaxID=36809 RepID=UPI000943588B|nr:hypothetical protein [Mycobacteroides abscessus]
MSDHEEVRVALVGDTGLKVRPEFTIGLRAVMRWPVRAFAVEYNGLGYLETVYWLDGSSIGVYRFHSETAISTVIRPITAISALSVIASVEADGFNRGNVHKVLTIRFGSGGEEAIEADISVSDSDDIEHVSDLRKNFIAAVMNTVAGPVDSS